jgi:hypothetical protein
MCAWASKPDTFLCTADTSLCTADTSLCTPDTSAPFSKVSALVYFLYKDTM